MAVAFARAFGKAGALIRSLTLVQRAVVCTLGVAATVIAVLMSSVVTHAAPPTPVTIAVMYSSDRNRCFTPGVVTAIRHFTTQRAEQINQAGGIAGRPLNIRYFDDFATAEETMRNMDAALRLPNLVGIVGMSSSTRGQGVVDRVGDAGVPWISGMSRGDIYARFPSVFSMEPAVSDEIVAVRRFINAKKFKRPAFVGLDGDIYAASIAEAIRGESEANDSAVTEGNEAETGASPLQTHWLKRNADYTLDDDAIEKAVTSIRLASADIIFLAVHSGGGAQFLRKLRNVATPPP
ncbi:MAG: ABC transporter substrate-binding protein, partial [Pseudomonadota bacterium]